MHRLMIKTHNKTGKKYLCVTIRERWQEYPGSGVYWNKHLKKHGYDFSTELLFENEDYYVFESVCIRISVELNVALSEDFANLIPETGGDGYQNFLLYWKYATEEIKLEIFSKRAKTLKETYDLYGVSEEKRQKISLSNRYYVSKLSLDERREMTSAARKASLLFFDDKDSPRYKLFIDLKSSKAKEKWANMTEEEIKDYGQKVSLGRLNMSKEKKELRASRISKSFKESEKRKKFNENMKITRIGVNNPSSKKVLWNGKELTLGELRKYRISNGLTEKDIEHLFNTRDDCMILYEESKKAYEEITCPVCRKTTNSKPSAFKRWHFNNCKGLTQ